MEFKLQTTETGRYILESCLAQEEEIPLSDHANNDAIIGFTARKAKLGVSEVS